MHFNDLIIRFRIQALGGLAIVSGILGLARGAEEIAWKPLGVAFLALLLFWIAIWILDLAYYSKLLRGAVEELKRIEPQIDEVQLSTQIDAKCTERRATCTGVLFYAISGTAIVGIAILCFCSAL